MRARGAHHCWMQAIPITTQLQNLLWPLACAGCGRWDVALCEACEALTYQPLRRIDGHHLALAGKLAVWARTAGSNETMRIARTYMQATRTDIHPLVDQAMAEGADQWWARCISAQDGLQPTVAKLRAGATLNLAPLPGRRVQLRQHERLARAVAAGLRSVASPPHIRVRQLFSNRVFADQLRLRKAARGSGATLLVASWANVRLIQASDLLRARGIDVVGAIVFAPGVGSGHDE